MIMLNYNVMRLFPDLLSILIIRLSKRDEKKKMCDFCILEYNTYIFTCRPIILPDGSFKAPLDTFWDITLKYSITYSVST